MESYILFNKHYSTIMKTTSLFFTLILILFIVGCTEQIKNSDNNNNTNCAKLGETIGAVDMPEGCCSGLKPVAGWGGGYEGDCSIPAPPGGLSICAPCGNGICDIEYGENKCNCPDDCG
jgi:hypothetical protein